jgi:acetyl-CoA acetyltransferase family protein
MKDVAIVAAVRSPVGRARKGSLTRVRMDDLAASLIREAIRRAGPKFDPGSIEDVLVGCAMPEGEQGMNVARMIGILAGVRIETGAATMNRFCGSSMQTLHDASRAIAMGEGDTFVIAGIETMTNVPMGGFNVSFNKKLYRNPEMPDAYIPMGITAENVVERFGLTREQQDEFAYESHMKAIRAIRAGKLRDEILPVEVDDGAGGTRIFDTDECPREDTTVEALAKLKPAFVEGGSVTAGNSSPLNDGAAAMILMDASRAARDGVPILALVRGRAVVGVEPEVMGIGPWPATEKLLGRTGVARQDVDWFEINEAFASQSIVVVDKLGIDPAKVNPHGGAIAIGHPLGCSGARILTTLVHDLANEGGRLGVAAMCIGGGQGIATLIEIP